MFVMNHILCDNFSCNLKAFFVLWWVVLIAPLIWLTWILILCAREVLALDDHILALHNLYCSVDQVYQVYCVAL